MRCTSVGRPTHGDKRLLAAGQKAADDWVMRGGNGSGPPTLTSLWCDGLVQTMASGTHACDLGNSRPSLPMNTLARDPAQGTMRLTCMETLGGWRGVETDLFHLAASSPETIIITPFGANVIGQSLRRLGIIVHRRSRAGYDARRFRELERWALVGCLHTLPTSVALPVAFVNVLPLRRNILATIACGYPLGHLVVDIHVLEELHF